MNATYHYRECGLPNVHLTNGYREVATPYGKGFSIEAVEDLHTTLALSLVEEKPSLTGPEARFIRKLLELTQAQLAELLGIDDQSVRRWEKLEHVPKQADHAIRLVFRDLTGQSTKPLADIVRQIGTLGVREPRTIRYHHNPTSSPPWRPDLKGKFRRISG
ncbi:MAG: helix-turn-helix domain-containing protein [Proteobacteria bacterium]|nr:helix-turn-helix domain-containing protein [Pseudomonadota bacterium]